MLIHATYYIKILNKLNHKFHQNFQKKDIDYINYRKKYRQ